MKKAGGKGTEKQETTSSIKTVRCTLVPWVFPGVVVPGYILGLQAAKVNAEHGPMSLEVDFCLWLSVSVLFIQDKTICWKSYCLHTWAEATGSWLEGRILVCLFLWMEHSPACPATRMQPYCFNILEKIVWNEHLTLVNDNLAVLTNLL